MYLNLREKNMKENKIEYGNWVSLKIINCCLIIGLIFISFLIIVVLINTNISILAISLIILFSVLALFSLLSALYFIYSRYLFSAKGGDIQNKILKTVEENIDWDGKGKALDIGCGSGHLSIIIAQKFKNAEITGIDYWGGAWEYSKSVCESNAHSEGVNDRCSFIKGSAAKLPFEDETFDLVVSNLVFHEVSVAADKKELIKEALRVLKKGGKFVLQDLFLIERYYGNTESLIKEIKSWGIEKVTFNDTSKAAFIPKALKLPFMVGTIAMLSGEK